MFEDPFEDHPGAVFRVQVSQTATWIDIFMPLNNVFD
jgi:hypothetical protein